MTIRFLDHKQSDPVEHIQLPNEWLFHDGASVGCFVPSLKVGWVQSIRGTQGQSQRLSTAFELKGHLYLLLQSRSSKRVKGESAIRELDLRTGKTLASMTLDDPLMAPNPKGTSIFYAEAPYRPAADPHLYELSLDLKTKTHSLQPTAVFRLEVYANGKVRYPESETLGFPKKLYPVAKGLFIDYENDTVDVPGPVKGIVGLGFVPWSKGWLDRREGLPSLNAFPLPLLQICR